MIIAQNRQLATILPVRLAYDADGYLAGQVLGRRTDGLYAKYADAGTSGLDTARSVLLEDHGVEDFSVQSAAGSTMAKGCFGGELYKDLLVTLTAAAIVDFAGKTIIDATGVNVFKF